VSSVTSRSRNLASRKSVLSSAEAWARHGWRIDDPIVRNLIESGMPPIAGGAQGLNPAVFMNNAPPPGSYTVNQQQFDMQTERNDVPQPSVAWPGFGARIDQRIINVGVLAKIRLNVQLSLVVSGSGAVTSLYPFPYNLLKEVVINANGGSAIIDVQGLDLRARMLVQGRNSADPLGLNTAPGMDTTATLAAASPYRPIGKQFPGTIANGTYTVNMVVDIPIAHSMRTLVGALFAQSDQTYLNWVVNTAQIPDVFTVAAGGAVAITGTIYPELTFFSIPTFNSQSGRLVVLPQGVNWLHEMIASDFFFSNTADVIVPLTRTNGQLRRIFSYIDNGGAAQITPLTLSNIKWMYGGNQTPRNFAPAFLLRENQLNYSGPIEPGYMVIDFEAENLNRDVVYPRGLAELDVDYYVPSGTTVNANAHVHTTLETLTTV
jgi:hypothetical protein